MIRVDFLDVSFDLITGKYQPYRKPNDAPMYIHKDSNHPANIIKQLPTMIQDRISSLSYSQEEFDNGKDVYVKSLKESGFNVNINYNHNAKSDTISPKNRKKKSSGLIHLLIYRQKRISGRNSFTLFESISQRITSIVKYSIPTPSK